MPFVVETTLEEKSGELPEGNQVMMMQNWQEGNEQLFIIWEYLVSVADPENLKGRVYQ